MSEFIADETVASPAEKQGDRLRELARLFLWLGTFAFGGPAAHIAMMEDEVVRRRGWITRESFLDMIGACNLIPGPNSTEMAIHIGHRRAGFTGLAVAGASFIIPAVLITIGVAWAYVAFAATPQVNGIFYGVKPVIIAVVVQALWRLGQTAVNTRFLRVVTILAVAAGFAGVNEIVLLFATGLLMVAVHLAMHPGEGRRVCSIVGLPLIAALKGGVAGGVATPFSLGALFLIFLKIGSVLFGSGYVLLAFLQADLVDRTHWLTQGQLLDAVAVGQITPGPVFCTATFVGYLLGRTRGALVATIGIFLPAFFFVAISGPLLPRLRRSAVAGAFLDGVNAASLALMVIVTWQLSRTAIVDVATVVMALAAAVLLLRFRINSAWLVMASAIAGAAIMGIRGH